MKKRKKHPGLTGKGSGLLNDPVKDSPACFKLPFCDDFNKLYFAAPLNSKEAVEVSDTTKLLIVLLPVT